MILRIEIIGVKEIELSEEEFEEFCEDEKLSFKMNLLI